MIYYIIKCKQTNELLGIIGEFGAVFLDHINKGKFIFEPIEGPGKPQFMYFYEEKIAELKAKRL